MLTWLLQLNTFVSVDSGDPDIILFGPRLDKADGFFDGKTLEQLVEEAPPKSTFMMLMSEEGGVFAFDIVPMDRAPTYSIDDFDKTIEGMVCPPLKVEDELEPMKSELTKFYLHRADRPSTLLQKTSNVISDVMFNQAVIESAELKARKHWDMYFCVWDYTNPQTRKIPIRGAFHSSELRLLFDNQLSDIQSEDDEAIRDTFSEAISNFCKTGNPSTDVIKFPKYDVLNRSTLWFNLAPIIRGDPFKDRRIFWNNFVRKFRHDIIHGRPRK